MAKKSKEETQEKAEITNTVTITDAGPCKKKVSVEVPEAAIKEELNKQYKELQHDAILPGFRKGRAPMRLLEKRFGKDVMEQVKLKVLADASDKAIKDNKIDMLGDPNIEHEKVELPDNGPLKFEFEVEVRPEFELPALEGIAVNKPKYEVDDEQVGSELQNLQRRNGLWVPQEGGKVESGDQVIADAVLAVEGEPEPQRHDNTEIYVRPRGFVGPVPVENLEDLLKGAKQGDTKTTKAEVAATFYDEKYRGKKVDVTITIKDIKRLIPAELNEEFIKKFGVENEQALRDRIREMMADRNEQRAQDEIRGQVYKHLLDNTSFELPADVVADQSRNLLQRELSNLIMRGVPREELTQHVDEIKAGSEERAREQLKTFFIMDKVAEKLGLEVSEEEINGQIARVAMQRGRRPEKMREEMVRDGSLAQFTIQIREDKCVSKLLETAKVTEVEPSAIEESKKKPAKKAAKKEKTEEAKPEGEEAPKKSRKKKESE